MFFIWANHLEDLFIDTNKVLDVLWENGLQVNFQKAHFGVTEGKNLGYQLISGGRIVSEQITQKIRTKMNMVLETEEEDPLTRIQKILGMLGYYRKHIHRYAEKTKFLTDKLKKEDEEKIISKEEVEQIRKILGELEEKAILYAIDPMEKVDIYTDASGFVAGYVAIQKGKIIDVDSHTFA